MRFRLLGPVELVGKSGALSLGGSRPQAILATLLLNAGQTVTAGQLADGAWVEPPRAVASNVRTYIARLRHLFAAAGEPASRLVTENGGYRLVTYPGEVDVVVFEALVRQGQHARRQMPAVAMERLGEAMRLWRGAPLAGAVIGPLLQAEVARLEELRIAVIEQWADLALQAGHHDDVAAELMRIVRTYPLRERLWAQLMLALQRGGHQAEALSAYQDVHRLLGEELGLEPGPALRRLRRQILTAGSALDTPAERDMPAAAPQGQLVVPRQLPPDLRGFVGRSEELSRLDAVAFGAGRRSVPALWVIAGTAGVGKTTLAVHWAHRVADRFTGGQLYVNLRGYTSGGPAMSASEAVRGFLQALGVPPEHMPTGMDAQVGLYRSLLAGRRVLVLLDNAGDAEQVRPLLPGAPDCVVLVTSRDSMSGLVAREGAEPLRLELLSTVEARQLLRRRLGPARVAAEPQAADQIIASCARLPLALAIVAAHAKARPILSLTELAENLRGTRDDLQAFCSGDSVTDVRAVLSWSYHRLGPDVAALFRLLGTHPGPDIAVPAAASLSGLPVRRTLALLDELARAHLITECVPGRYALHDLLRRYAGELTRAHDSATARRVALRRMLDHYLHTAHAATLLLEPHRHDEIAPPPPQPGVLAEQVACYEQAMAWFAAEHQVLQAVQQAATTRLPTYAWQLAWCLTEYFDRRGLWHDWATVQSTALEAARQADSQTGQAHTHRDLGRACAHLRRFDEAHAHLYRALEFLDAEESADRADLHYRLSGLSHLRKRHGDALRHARVALNLFRAADDLSGQAGALNAIGSYHCELGRYRQALLHCRQALSLQERIADRRGQAGTWDSLGLAHQRLGQHARAIKCYEHAARLYQELGDRYYQADTLLQLGDCWHLAGHREAAHDAWGRAIALFDELGHAQADQARARLQQLSTPATYPGRS